MCLVVLDPARLLAQSSTYWTGATDGNWSTTNNWNLGIPGSTGTNGATRILNFTNGATRTSATNDINNLSGFRIFFNTNAQAYTLSLKAATGGTTLNDFGGVQPQVQNDSTNVQTVDMSFKMQAKGISGAANEFANINPTQGDLVFTTNCTISLITNTQLKIFSTAGHTVTFNGPITNIATVSNACVLATTGSGGIGPTVIFANTSDCTNTFIACGTARLAAGNVTTAPITIGDTAAANAPAAILLLDNGFTNSSPLVIQPTQPSPTNSKTIGNSAFGSGAATYAGPVSVGTNVTLTANSAGALVFTGNFDFQNPAGGTSNRTILITGAGNTTISGNLTNASTGISVVTKTNAGTLTLTGSNAPRILYNNGGGVISISNAAAIGIPTNAPFPDKFNFTANSTLRVTNSFTLGSSVSATNNAGFRIAGGATGTFDVVAGSTFTVDGVIADIPSTGSGNLAKTSAGTLVLTQPNTYSGATTVSAGTLKASNSSGSATGTGPVDVTVSGQFGGAGFVSGSVSIEGTISPGNSPGTITTGSETWNNGGHYTWEINSASGIAGADPGWDLISVNGALTNDATAGGFNIDITGLNSGELQGAVAGFNASSTYTWIILHTTGGVSGFSASDFTLNSANFANNNALGGGVFNLVATNGGDDLALNFNPAPVAGTASYSRPRDTQLHIKVGDLLTNDTDLDGGTISLVSVSATSTNGAAVSIIGGFIAYSPPASNGNVTDSFSYAIQDSFGATSTGTVIISILPDDNGPSVNITGMTTLPDGTKQLNFAGIPGYNYLIQATTNITPPITWTTLTNLTAGTNGLFQFVDLDATNFPTRYYRTANP